MSRFEQIFLDPGGLPIQQAADTLARTLRLDVTWFRGDWTLTGTAADADIPAGVGGTLEPNIYAENSPRTPEEISIFDPLPLVFEFCTAKKDYELQRETARILYTRMIENLRWTSALTSEYSDLVAAFDPTRGLRTFDAGTLSDGTHQHLWG